MIIGKLHWKAHAHVKRDFKEIFLAEIISITGGILAGALLASIFNKILLLPGLLILIPGFLELRGNISGALAARIGSALDANLIKPKIIQKYTIENFIATFVEVLVVSLVLAGIAYFFTYVVLGQATLNIFIVAIIAAVLSNLIESSSTIFFTFFLFKKGHDPNNIMGPYVTTSGDIIAMLSLAAAILLVP
ncbi:MAG: magnesium transporter [Candidatus Nanoarchaeia archaeon]